MDPGESDGIPVFEPPRLLDRVRGKIRLRHYSIRTEQAYLDWIRRFIRFHGKRHPDALGAPEVEAFLTHLAVEHNVAAATQNLAKSSILFLYREVLERELPWLDHVERARTPARLPVVLTRQEVIAILRRLRGVHRLIGRLLYGTGMRIMEGVRLRVKDVDFSRLEILVRDGKGFKDRVTMLPDGVVRPLCTHLELVRERTRSTSPTDSATSGARTRSPASIPPPRAIGAGSMSFRPTAVRPTRGLASSAAIM